MRRKVVAANWKMNMTPTDATKFTQNLKKQIHNPAVDVIMCVPAIDIIPVYNVIQDTQISVGAENMYCEDCGAYTGELSPEMLKDAGVEYVIVGHSERREYFSETDELIQRKVKKALQHQIIPIICCGETAQQREEGVTDEVIRIQIRKAFYQIPQEQAKKCIIAYEPIWAIGTGVTATAEQAQEVCSKIRACMTTLYGKETAEVIRVLYGGSVNADNMSTLFIQKDIDGGLIGGASLKMDFVHIVNHA